MRKGVDKRAMAALSVGHLFTDVNQGAVAALIPFLVAERGLSLAAAGTLVLAATLSSSIVQPLFGFFSDRTPLPALMPLGVMVGGAGIALVGVAPNYLLILICTVLSGLGVAAFHPESARFASYVSGARRARGMSFFSVGGNAGSSLYPLCSWASCSSTSCPVSSLSGLRRRRLQARKGPRSRSTGDRSFKWSGPSPRARSCTLGSSPSWPSTISVCSKHQRRSPIRPSA